MMPWRDTNPLIPPSPHFVECAIPHDLANPIRIKRAIDMLHDRDVRIGGSSVSFPEAPISTIWHDRQADQMIRSLLFLDGVCIQCLPPLADAAMIFDGELDYVKKLLAAKIAFS